MEHKDTLVNILDSSCNSKNENSIMPRFVKKSHRSCSDWKDYIHHSQSIFNTLKEMFKVIMACFLAVFVPQKCNGNEMCSVEDNITLLSEWNKLVLAFNCITAFFVVIVYLVESYREVFLIRHFDKNESEPDNNLMVILKSDNEILRKIGKGLRYVNNLVFYAYFVSLLAFIANIVLSGVLIFNDHYLDSSSITIFITNILLLFGKLVNGFVISLQSKNKGVAYSLTLTEPISWNVIDKDVEY
jgi:hypothetical protein